MTAGRAEPILPGRDLREQRAFYERLGFRATYAVPDGPHGYLMLLRGDVMLHFFAHAELDPSANYAGCYWRVRDADEVHRELAAVGLPSSGIPRLTPPEDKPWGVREFAFVDPSGNLVRVGHELKTPAA